MDMLIEKDGLVGELEQRAPYLYTYLCILQRFINSSCSLCFLRYAGWKMELLGLFF